MRAAWTVERSGKQRTGAFLRVGAFGLVRKERE